MRLDAMCCEVSLSHWIEPGRLTAAPCYRRLRGGEGGKSGSGTGTGTRTGLGPPSSAGGCCCCCCCLLPPRFSWCQLGVRHRWPFICHPAVVSFRVSQRRMWGWFPSHMIRATQESLTWIMTGEKLQECDKNAPIWLRAGALLGGSEQPRSRVVQQDCCRVK